MFNKINLIVHHINILHLEFSALWALSLSFCREACVARQLSQYAQPKDLPPLSGDQLTEEEKT